MENGTEYECPHSSDALLRKLSDIRDETWLEKVKKKAKNGKMYILITILLSIGVLSQLDEAKDIWRWIKLQAMQILTFEPTLASDPIGVFSKTFITHTASVNDIDTSQLIALNFKSITRFKTDSVRFKAEFKTDQEGKQECDVVVEGNFNEPEGGITTENYYIAKRCGTASAVLMEEYHLVAYPPSKNTMLAPPKYFLTIQQEKG